MEAQTLLREFAPRAAPYRDGLLLFRADDALQLVNRAAEAGVPVVRIGGRHEGSGQLPDDGADFAAAVREGHGCWTEAEAFIRGRQDRGLLFEVTLGDDPLNAA